MPSNRFKDLLDPCPPFTRSLMTKPCEFSSRRGSHGSQRRDIRARRVGRLSLADLLAPFDSVFVGQRSLTSRASSLAARPWRVLL
jgi:hypothetical protein